VAEQVVEPRQPHLGAVLEPVGVGPEAREVDHLVAVGCAPVTRLLQDRVELLPALDQSATAVTGAAQQANRGRRVVLEQPLEPFPLVLARVVPLVLGLADLAVEGGVVSVAAVGEQGGVDALVDQVLGGGALGLVVVFQARVCSSTRAGSQLGSTRASARRPCFRALRRDMPFPWGDRGPVACCALRRLIWRRSSAVRAMARQLWVHVRGEGRGRAGRPLFSTPSCPAAGSSYESADGSGRFSGGH
jgi:hypothetical protein